MVLSHIVPALRSLGRSPAFAVSAVALLTLGIGASAATFTVLNGVLLRPLPYANPDRLVLVMSDLRERNVEDLPLSEADFIDIGTNTVDALDDVAAVLTGRGAVPQQDGSLEEIRWARVTPNFFRTMGARMVLGRDFVEADARPVYERASSGYSGAPGVVARHDHRRKKGTGLVGPSLPSPFDVSVTVVA